jgi:hypothetical protein
MKKSLLIIFSFLTILSNAQDRGITGPGTTSKYVKVPSLASYSVPNDWSLQVWVKPPANILANEGIFGTNITNTTNNLFNLNYVTSGVGNYLQFRVYNSSGTNLVTTSLFKDIRDQFRNGHENTRYLASITCSYNGTNYTYKCYLNDSLISTTVKTTKPTIFSNFTLFQDRSVANRWGKSQIGDAKFYTSALSGSQVDSSFIYGSKFSNLLLHLKFDTVYQSGSDYYSPDSSGNGNVAQLISFTSPLSSVSNFTDGDQSTKKLIMPIGNSLTIGYAGQFATIAESDWWVKSDGVGGSTTLNMINRFETNVKPYFTPSWGENIAVIFEIGNDLFKGASLDSAKHNMMRYSDSVNTIGFTPWYVTLPARCNIADSTRRQANDWLIATYPNIIDPCLDTLFGDTLAYLRPAIYSDACTHFTTGGTGGYNKFATIIKNGLIGGGLRIGKNNIISSTSPSINIYPNPSNKYVSIEGEGEVYIFNSIGSIIYQGDNNISLPLDEGLYLVKVVSKNGTAIKKLIIK